MTESKKILVVDDDPDIHNFCKLVLERAGYQVLLAASGLQGKTLVGLEQPDLVILDIVMEEGDAGFLLAHWLSAEHPTIPVLMMSSIAEAAEQLFDTSTLKVAELVNKPLTPMELLGTVNRLFARKQG